MIHLDIRAQSIFNKEKKNDVWIRRKKEKMKIRKRKRVEKKMEGTKKGAMTHEEVKGWFVCIVTYVCLFLRVWTYGLYWNRKASLSSENSESEAVDLSGFVDINRFSFVSLGLSADRFVYRVVNTVIVRVICFLFLN